MADWTAVPGPSSLDKEPGYTHGPRRKQRDPPCHPPSPSITRSLPGSPVSSPATLGSPPAGCGQTAGLARAASDWEVPLTCLGPVMRAPLGHSGFWSGQHRGTDIGLERGPLGGSYSPGDGSPGSRCGEGAEASHHSPQPPGCLKADSAPLPAAVLMVAIQTPERHSWGALGTRAPTPDTPGPAPADSVLTPAGSQTASRRCRTRRGGPRSSGR